MLSPSCAQRSGLPASPGFLPPGGPQAWYMVPGTVVPPVSRILCPPDRGVLGELPVGLTHLWYWGMAVTLRVMALYERCWRRHI